MNNIKKKLLLATALVGVPASLVIPTNTVEANHLSKIPSDNMIPRIEYGKGELEGVREVPLVYEMSRSHPHYNYYIEKGLHVRGKVYAYLQYNNGYYYYSPIFRFYDDNGDTDKINKDIQERLKYTDIYPEYNDPSSNIGNHLFGGNTVGKHGNPGVSNDKSINDVAKSIPGLHHSLPGGKPDYNFRQYTMYNAFYSPWTKANIRRTPKQKIKREKHYGTWKYGEYRNLGYSASGANITNPIFPVDGVATNNTQGLKGYPLLEYPWAHVLHRSQRPPKLTSIVDEKVYQYAIHVGKIPYKNVKRTTNSYGRKINNQWNHKDNYDNSGITWNQQTVKEYKNLYEQKKRIMRELYYTYDEIRNNIRIRGMSDEAAIEALTIKYVSLDSQPFSDVVTSVSFGREPIWTSSRGWHFYSLSLTAPEFDTESNHIEIEEQKVIDDSNNRTLQTFTRSRDGKTRLTNHTSNGRIPRVKAGSRLRVETTVYLHESSAPSTNAIGRLQFRTSLSGGDETLTIPGNRRIHRDRYNVFTKKVTIPNNQQGIVEFHGELDERYYIEHGDMKLGKNTNTALNRVEITPRRGTFESLGIDLINRSGQVVDNPIPGNEYKIRYRYRYTGNVPDNVTRTAVVSLRQNVGREMRNPAYVGYESQGYRTIGKESGSLYNGKIFTFETGYDVYETGQIDTNASLRAEVHDIVRLWRWKYYTVQVPIPLPPRPNPVPEGWKPPKQKYKPETRRRREYYDKIEEYPLSRSDKKDWKSNYDIRVGNVVVLPTSIQNTHNQKGVALVKFDVDYDIPSFVSHLGHDVDVAVKVDGRTVHTIEHIRKGKNRNITIPVEIDYPANRAKTINAEVIVNNNKYVFESDDYQNIRYRNNYARGSGKLNDYTVSAFQDSNRKRNWSQFTERNSWNGERINYRTFNGSRGLSFDKFTRPDNKRTERRNFYEQYQIDAVRFRSRLTQQEGLGDDGWVNLMEDKGYIKAGYGYELEIDVSYKTNAHIPNSQSKVGVNGRWTRPIISEALLQDNVYIEMPDGKLRSVQGDGGTEQALRLKSSTGTGTDKKWTFEIDGGQSLGVNTTGRFYFGDRVKDGDYEISVFTPKIRGISGKMTSSTQILEHLLYDSANKLQIEVVGAHVDDISDHINK